MRDPKHIAAALKKQPWTLIDQDIYCLHKDSFKDVKLWGDLKDFLKSERLKGTEKLEQSLFLEEYRYWFDTDENIFRQLIVEEPVTDLLLDSWLEKMLKFFDKLPDNSEICTAGLFEKVCKVKQIYNHGYHWWQMLVDGKYYGEYVRKDGSEIEIDWELYNRFYSAIENRTDIIEDGSQVAFMALGLPYNIPKIYRKKAPLLEHANTLSEKDAVRDGSGNLLYYHTLLHPSDGNTLELIKIKPGASPIKRETGEETKMVAVLSGEVKLESFHQRLCSDSVEGDGEVFWQDNDCTETFDGHGEIYCRHDRSYEEPDIPSFHKITNVGTTDALVLVSSPER